MSDVAKDLGVSVGELAELLSKYDNTPKKAATALTEAERNHSLEHYTRKHEVKDFNDYFAMQDQKPAPAEAKPEPAKAEKKSALAARQDPFT